ncbi:MAG: hypothetical protein ABJF10_13940 [Chthoniobacter sp.]|uniref:hypothetical protein n=1 Tax=Chthoniobacter sp. TaxID=2510640 RepID=UPI0032A94A66
MHFKLNDGKRHINGRIVDVPPIRLRGSCTEMRWEIRRYDQHLLRGCEFGIPRFKLHVGRDLKVTDAAGEPRRVVIKTLKYPLANNAADYEAKVRETRRNLDVQIELLNLLDTPLLAQPLDDLRVSNSTDGLPNALKHNEPALVLAWQPGNPLPTAIRNGIFTLRPKPGAPPLDDQPGAASPADSRAIANFGRSIVSYLRLLSDHNVVCFDLNPRHILVAGNRVPRFLGIGSLCPLRSDGTVDETHPNYLTTSFGYMPPELSNPSAGHGLRATTATLGAFALGAILVQMVTGEEKLPREWVPRGSLVYPQPSIEEVIQERCGRFAKAFHHLISLLCVPDPAKRGTNLESIDDFLAVIADDADASPEMVQIVQPLLRGADVHAEGTLVAVTADGSNAIAFCDDPQVGEIFLDGRLLQELPEAAIRFGQPITLFFAQTRQGPQCRQVQTRAGSSNPDQAHGRWHAWLKQHRDFFEGIVSYVDPAGGFAKVFTDEPEQGLLRVPGDALAMLATLPTVDQVVLVRPQRGPRGWFAERLVPDCIVTAKRATELRRLAIACDTAQRAERRDREFQEAPWINGQMKFFDSVNGFGYIIAGDGGDDISVNEEALSPNARNKLFEGTLVRCKARTRQRDGKRFALALELR